MYGSMVTARRKHDAVVAVKQDNDNQSMQIKDANTAAERLTGFSKAELIGKTFQSILPDTIQDTVDSYVEFDEGGDDLATVLKRTRHFEIKNREGENVPVNLKVFYTPAKDSNPRFEILMRDITLQEQLENIKKQIVEEKSKDAALDIDTGLPNIASLSRYVEIVGDYVSKHDIEATFALIDIEQFYEVGAEHGKKMGDALVKAVAELVGKVFRQEDTLGYLGEGVLVAILFDCNAASAPAPLGRIRNKVIENPVEANPGVSIKTTLNMSFKQIKEGDTLETVMEQCADKLELTGKKGGNRIEIA